MVLAYMVLVAPLRPAAWLCHLVPAAIIIIIITLAFVRSRAVLGPAYICCPSAPEAS